MSREKGGFTLIELLVVIAIIALLAGIFFPVFARARENARKANCVSNLKQQGLAFQMYVQDWDYWPNQYWVSGPGYIYYWNYLAPYLSDDTSDAWGGAKGRMCKCPSRTTNYDYAYNGYMNNIADSDLEKTKNPGGKSSIVVLMDSVTTLVWGTQPQNVARRHNDTANFLFADGHVSSVKSSVKYCDMYGNSTTQSVFY